MDKSKMNHKPPSSLGQKSDVSYVGVTTKPHSHGAEGSSGQLTPSRSNSSTPLPPSSMNMPSAFTASLQNEAVGPGPPSKNLAFQSYSSKSSAVPSLAGTPVPFGKGQFGAFTPSGGTPTPQQMEKVRSELQRFQMQLPPLDNELETRDEVRQRELEEAKTRANQMEKTMRWWSDCTANWREKWSKVRNERNKSREECRQLRNKLETLVKELNGLQREKHELKSQNEKMKKEMTSVQNDVCDDEPGLSSGGGARKSFTKGDNIAFPEPDITLITSEKTNDVHAFGQFMLDEPDDPTSLMCESAKSKKDKADKSKKRRSMELPKYDVDPSLSPSAENTELMDQKVAAAEMKLEEAQKTIQAEREKQHKMRDNMEQLEYDLIIIKEKYEDLKKSKQDVVSELSKLREEHMEELSRVNQDLEDESCSRFSMDQTVADLRTELERLQAENAAEWGKRERIETEKLALERENKKLRNQIEELEGSLEKRQRLSVIETDLKAVQQECYDKNKELCDLKHSHAKLKKIHQEKSTELDHAKRRAEQYEIEVKKLRTRIEDLKRDLASAEDEVDMQTNNTRKLQRTNDELHEELENLHTQLQHSQSRLRRASSQNQLNELMRVKSQSFNDSTELESDENL